MSKTPKPTTIPKKRTKIVPYDYHFDLSLREKPISIPAIEMLAEELVNWALNDETARKVRPFFTKRGINNDAIKRWSKRNKKFKMAYALALAAIGDRREDGALTRKFAESTVLRSMHHYDEAWKSIDKWQSDLKKNEQEQKATTFNVSMPSFSEKKDKGNDKDKKSGDVS